MNVSFEFIAQVKFNTVKDHSKLQITHPVLLFYYIVIIEKYVNVFHGTEPENWASDCSSVCLKFWESEASEREMGLCGEGSCLGFN